MIFQGISPQPPKELSTLLGEVKALEDAEQSVWVQRFRRYLHNLDQSGTASLLDFAIKCQVLNVLEAESKRSSVHWKRKEDLAMEKSQLIAEIYDENFAENAPSSIPLLNQELRDELYSLLHRVMPVDKAYVCEDKVLSEIHDLLWQARLDYKVWKGGLDISYKHFISLRPSPTLTAVIMSIL